jgi:alkyldihydroxyacetonephosphate synthase
MTERRRSFWGWGWEDKFPDDDGRRNLAQLAGMFLGVTDVELGDVPTEADIRVPAPRIEAPKHLSHLVSTDVRDRACHTYGRSYPDVVRGYQGDFSPAPDAVLRPENEADVIAALAWASEANVALIPFGGGTSVVGGIEPDVGDGFDGVVSLDMSRMNRLLDVNLKDMTAVIEAGAFGPHLEAELAAHGLTLRHYPQSFEFSTLGGWIATRAGGHFATVYTHIDELVASARMVTADGIWEAPSLPGSGAGPDPNRMVCGSEGALGIITRARMRVRPRPSWRGKANVLFDDWDAALASIREISQSGLFPSNCRLLDKREAMLNQVAAGSHVLLLGFESAHGPRDAQLAQALEIATRHGGQGQAKTSQGNDEAASWKASFLEAPYMATTLVTMGLMADTFETACHWSAFPALHADIVATVRGVLQDKCGSGFVSCRFTHVYPDGPAPYYTFIGRPAAGAEVETWWAVKRAASDVLRKHGATITHHHAVGRFHRPWYTAQSPAPFLTALRATKDALDPAGVLNPGVLLPARDRNA